MKHVPYKYNIYDFLRKLSVEDYEVAIKLLPETCGVTWATFRNWIYVKQGEKLDIPGTAILKMAIFFAVLPAEMYNEPPTTKVLEDFATLKSRQNV